MVEGRQQDFGIRLRAKCEAGTPEFVAQFEIVVDFPVKDDVVTAIDGCHGLMAACGEIQDRQPAVQQHYLGCFSGRPALTLAQPVPRVRQPAMVIRPPVLQAVQHPVARRGETGCHLTHDSCNPAHFNKLYYISCARVK